MGEVLPLPHPGEVFDDVRGEDRMMRVSHHSEAGVVVISLWAGPVCRASFRLSAEDAPRLADVLAELADTITEPAAAPPLTPPVAPPLTRPMDRTSEQRLGRRAS